MHRLFHRPIQNVKYQGIYQNDYVREGKNFLDIKSLSNKLGNDIFSLYYLKNDELVTLEATKDIINKFVSHVHIPCQKNQQSSSPAHASNRKLFIIMT